MSFTPLTVDNPTLTSPEKVEVRKIFLITVFVTIETLSLIDTSFF